MRKSLRRERIVVGSTVVTAVSKTGTTDICEPKNIASKITDKGKTKSSHRKEIYAQIVSENE